VKNLAQLPKILFLMSAVLMLLSSPGRVFADDSIVEAARELAGKIQASIEPQKTIVLTFKSIASLNTTDTEVAHQALKKELRTRGIRLVPDSQATVGINITLSENLQQYLWVAEIKRGDTNDLVMTTRERLSRTPPKDVALQMTIQAKLIYEQERPILDLKLLDEDLLVLTPDSLSLHHRNNDLWELERSFSLPIVDPLPRDVRGRLSSDGDSVQIHLPGLFCRETDKQAFIFECSREEIPWSLPLDRVNLAAARNYFVRENLPPFYALADMKDGKTSLWVVAGIDRRTYLYDSSFVRIDTMADSLGSEIVAVDSECGTKRQLLAALRTDPLERGVIQAFEIINRKAVAGSSIVEFPGPITALWPVNNRNIAIAVARDVKTGRYAAFHLSISCNR
jgi:hypothetical protein